MRMVAKIVAIEKKLLIFFTQKLYFFKEQQSRSARAIFYFEIIIYSTSKFLFQILKFLTHIPYQQEKKSIKQYNSKMKSKYIFYLSIHFLLIFYINVYNIQKMYALEKIITRKQKYAYQLHYAFEKIKLHTLKTDTNYIFFKHLSSKSLEGQNRSMHSIEIQNKELYLNYIEQVLKNKEQELVEFQEYLNDKQKKDEQENINRKIINPLAINHFAQLITKKIEVLKEIIVKFGTKGNSLSAEQELDSFNKNLLIVEQACRKNYQLLQNDMIKQYEQLNSEKHQFAVKLSKLAELQSYQKYLNEFQMALQRKQSEIVIREKEVVSFQREKELYSLHRQKELQNAKRQESLESYHINQSKAKRYEEENTYNDGEEIHIPLDVSIRKKVRIFQPKNMEAQSKVQKRQKKQAGVTPSMMESSKIMNQTSTLDYHNQIKEVKPQTQSLIKVCQSIGSQTLMEQSTYKIKQHSQKLYIKYVRFWLIFSRRKTKSDQNYKKTISLYLWRLNAVFDENVKQRTEQSLSWPKKIYKLKHIPDVNYESLSLKKKKYLQKLFDHEKKTFQRQKIIFLLKMVLKTKNRRERTAVVLYFKKYRHNIQLLGLTQLIMNRNQALHQITINKNVQSNHKAQQKILSKSSSNKVQSVEALNQKAGQKSYMKNSSIIMNHVSKSKLFKDNNSSNIDMNKLRQYIKAQEQVQAKLAIQCYKTESVFRIQHTLSKTVTKVQYLFLSNLMKITETTKINMLEKNINSAQFKWELFMAKARLAITNNANKISHLEQLMSFI